MDENNKQLNTGNNIKTVRTYLSDMADTVRANDISVIKVALAEQNRNERENIYREAEGSPMKKIFWIIGGVILIGGSIFGAYYILNEKAKQNVPIQIAKEEAIISYDEISSIDSTDGLADKIITIKKEVTEGSKAGSIKYISISNNVAGVKEKIVTKDLFSSLGFSASSSLVRALSNTFMVGTYSMDKPHLFMIFEIKDYDYAYSGMLEWEKTLVVDFLNLFEIDTNETKLQIGGRKWSDLIINNWDSRTFSNENGNVVLYYLFNNKNYLIVTDNKETINEIINKLIVKNIKPF